MNASDVSVGGMIDRRAVAHRVARLHARLRTPWRPTEVWEALDDVCDSLGALVHDCGDDADLATRLGETRAVAGSYLLATLDLTEVDLEAEHCATVLRRGRDRVLEELAAVQRSLLAEVSATDDR